MATPLLAAKLYIPSLRPKIVRRPRLVDQLNDGIHGKLTLVAAPAGFGKTTLVGEWISHCERPTAWLSLDEGDGDRARFLTYLVAALRTIQPKLGDDVLGMLQSPQTPPIRSVLTSLLNDIADIHEPFTLVLDDYHVVNIEPINEVLAFLLEHQSPRMHLVIITREDPHLSLPQLRARSQLTELRSVDLRFTASEAEGFLNKVMNLNLSAEDVAELETRTEGWIAGMQLAAISMRGNKDGALFIRSFTGNNRFVMDYLVENVLMRQPENVQDFLLRTSILDRLCGPLCDAVLRWTDDLGAAPSGQETLEYLEAANLFIIPLDDERRWYRYHHLFAELLRQQLRRKIEAAAENAERGVAELHRRAGAWFENNGFEIEAFRHAVASGDIDYAGRLMEGKGMPLHFRGAVGPVLKWLESLPPRDLDERPSLWVMYASALSMTGQISGVESKLQAAEAALNARKQDGTARNLIGHIAAIRALLAAAQYQVETIIAQSQRALEYLAPHNVPVRTATIWKLGFAYQLQGDRVAAARSYAEAVAISRSTGNTIIALSAGIGLGNVQESQNQLSMAAETYRGVLQLADEVRLPAPTCDANLGMARILYQWNDLDAARRHGELSLHAARLLDNADRIVAATVFLARLALARGEVEGASAMLDDAGRLARGHKLDHRLPEIAAAIVLTSLKAGNSAEAERALKTHELPQSRVRTLLASGAGVAALAVLEPILAQAEAKGWEDERLTVIILQALALRASGEKEKAEERLGAALASAEPGGLIRVFVDEGGPMTELLTETAAHRGQTPYMEKLLTACNTEQGNQGDEASPSGRQPIDPLSSRELEVLRLIAAGLSNREIGDRLFLALSTVKGHSLRIFDKLKVRRRTEAVARARSLGLL